MVSSRNSPKRRRSIAVTNQIPSAASAKMKRRAHSIAPGAGLSPASKARRSLVPRKSILKSSVNALNVDPSSQSSTQSSMCDDTHATRSIDMATDFTAPLNNNTSRKSMGRRVSFAGSMHVRLFDSNHTNSTASPQSSPAAPEAQDENDYPRARSRKNSVRYSVAGSDDMEITTIIPAGFQRGSAILEEEFDYDDDEDMEFDDDTMEVTEAIRGNFARKRSLSVAQRQPLAELEAPEPEGANQTLSDIADESYQSEDVSVSEQTQPMEFTVPLNQSLRPPPEQDPAWLALKQLANADHDGDASYEEDSSRDSGMGLDDAMERLQRARDSLALPTADQEPQDDTFTSTEDSFNGDDVHDDGNKTLNLSRVLDRASLGNPRMSMGYQESNMEESEVYGAPSPPPQPSVHQPEVLDAPTRTSIFLPPPSVHVDDQTANLGPSATAPKSTAFTFSAPPFLAKPQAPPETPSKVKPRPKFTAAFAPPVARPSPKKTQGPSDVASPAKRPRPQDDIEGADADKPSPAKRQALAGKWLGSAKEAPTTSPAPPSVAKPKPLSPSKKARFEDSTSDNQPRSALRRPSNYFAKRKSMAVSFATSASTDEPAQVPQAAKSPKKKVNIGMGRASLGAGPSDAWTRFNKNAPTVDLPTRPTTPSKRATDVDAQNATPEIIDSLPEADQQMIVPPSPRRSPAPSSSTPFSFPVPSPAREPTVSPFVQVPSIAIHSPAPITNGRLTDIPEEAELSGQIDVNMEATQQWRDGVQQDELEDDDTPTISIAQFFSLTNIKFMDELTAPRKSMHPSQQPTRTPRNPAEIPLAEYVTAMAIDVPQLDLYSRVSRDLEAWMEKSKEVFAEAEEEASKVTPELFLEYARADEEGQAELLHQLNLIRTHTRFLAKSDWYDWKLQWVEGLRTTADEAFKSLENDARILEELKQTVDDVLPGLEEEYERLQADLEREQAEVTEIDSCDQDFLNDLKATIAEQNIVIEAFEAELQEGKEQLRWLSQKKDELAQQKREAKSQIVTAQRVLNRKQTSTRGEVFMLKEELEALEGVHMFRIALVKATVFEFVYGERYFVSIPCSNFRPIVSKITISRLPKSRRFKDDFPQLTNFLLAAAEHLISEGEEDVSVRQIVQRLADYWSACGELQTQLRMLTVRFPVDLSFSPPSKTSPVPSFRARTSVMFPKTSGKAIASFIFPLDTFARWPVSVSSLDAEVDVVYGPMDRSAILKAIMDRLSQATPGENYACLLEACVQAQDVYR